MKSRKFIVCFFVAGAFFKIILIILWRLYQPYEIIDLLFTYDPIGIFTAETAKYIFYDWFHFVSANNVEVLYIVVLVIAFAVECAVLGYIIQKIVTKLRPKTNSGANTTVL